MSTWRTFGKLTKVTEQSDGTILVEGVASSESVDSQGEVVKASAMANALPEYMRFPALREMHQPWAAGKTLGAVVEDGKTFISAKVVDAEACKKVREGVYAGFSIGGHVPPGGRNAQDAKVIEQLVLTEISLVDRPANPDAVLMLAKLGEAAVPGPGVQVTPGARAAQDPAVDSDPKDTTWNPGDTVILPTGEVATVASVRAGEVVTDLGVFKPGDLKASPKKDPQEKAASAEVKKGLYTVARTASLLSELADLQASTAFESACEGDGSPVPAALQAQVSALAATLRALVAEETAEVEAGAAAGTQAAATAAQLATELPPGATPAPPVDSVQHAEPEPELQKKGATFSAATKAALAGHHAELTNCLTALGKCAEAFGKGAWMTKDDDGGDDVSSAAVPGELQKAEEAAKAAGDALAKVLAERDEERLARAAAEAKADDLAKRLSVAEAEVKRKGALRAVGKAEDVAAPVAKAEPPAPAEGTPERVLYELKKVHASGPRRLG